MVSLSFFERFSNSYFLNSKMLQLQQMRLNANSLLMTSIRINQLITDSEAENGQVASSDDAEVEEDDG